MRIVGGRCKGRPLAAPKGNNLRPTSDRARESIFNILAHGLDGFDIDGQSVVDVFCGTGALGLEALSRGAAQVTFLDNSPEAIRYVRQNAGAMGVARTITCLRLDAANLAPPPLVVGAPVGLAFLDAPYNTGLTGPALLGLSRKGWLAPDGLAVVEIGADEKLAPPPPYRLLDERTYGAARVLFLGH